jgi:regulator of sigma E protease
LPDYHTSEVVHRQTLPRSIGRCYEISKLTVIGFGKLISGKLSAKSLGGPIYIYQLAGKSWKSGIYDFIGMLVGISISLATLNLMPIPVLDGGHIMFYTIEMILGRPLRYKTRQRATQVGMALVLCLMVFAFYNDLGRIAWHDLGWVKWLHQLFS